MIYPAGPGIVSGSGQYTIVVKPFKQTPVIAGANGEVGVAYSAQLSEAPVDLTKYWEWIFEPPRSLAGTSLPLDLTIGTVAAERAGMYSDVLTIELSAI